MDLILSDSFMSFSKCRGLPLLFQGQVVDACRPGVWEFMTVMKFQLEGFSVRDLRNLAREYRVFIEVVLTINIDGLVVVRILHDGDCFHIFSSHEGSGTISRGPDRIPAWPASEPLISHQGECRSRTRLHIDG